MPTNTTIFSIPKPLASEYFTLPNFNAILDAIESGVAGRVQMAKSTDDVGGVKINLANTTDDILASLLAQGKGVHTFYAISGSVNNPATSSSIRGMAHFSSSNTGWVYASDTNNNVYTNYCDLGTWRGWRKIISDTTTAWTNLTLQNSWVNSGGTYPNASYRLNALGEVELRGSIKSGTVTSGTTIATLPVGFRPTHDRNYVVYSTDGTNYVLSTIQIMSTGTIRLFSGGNVVLSLDSIPPIATT
ncbi:hypothetical protein AB1282_00215 [Gottfriedia sp. S16(2024)]|uniref:hypothetical protein n=1 Tax=Gottfriedia sp. S16(2024) TaxID=3162883 RepID=UPI003D1D6AE4